MSAKSNFIPHIAGLRGVAVLLVVLQHFGVSGFDGGFIGVDIFFVISGFLITGILVDEYSNSRDPDTRIGTISLKSFYLRRARRILPAALVVTLTIVIFSWLVNNSSRFGTVAADAIWSTLFSANLNFAFKSTDYFQIGAAPSPFQHFWSLSVEEQFYFLWPALILMALSLRALMFRGRMLSWQTRLSTLFWATTIASLVFMIATFYFQPSLSYFLTASRAWELSAGALAAIAIRSDHSSLKFLQARIVQYLPIPLLVISLFVVRADNFGYTMPLVIVAALIMVSKPSDTLDLDAKFLSSKALMFIGNISYSLYLWHWPVITFGTELGYASSVLGKVGLGAFALGLSTLSYYFIELKFLRIQIPKFYSDNSVPLSKPTWIGASSALLALTLVLPTLVVQPSVQSLLAIFTQKTDANSDHQPVRPPIQEIEPTKGSSGGTWFSRRQSEIASSNKEISDRGYLTEKQISEIVRVSSGESYSGKTGFSCTFGDCSLGSISAQTKILLLGDSQALMYHSTLSALWQAGNDLYVRSFVAASCPNSSGTRSQHEDIGIDKQSVCVDSHTKVLSHIKSGDIFYDYVLLSDSAHFDRAYYVRDAIDYAKKVKLAGKKTIVFGQAPSSRDLTTCLNRDYSNYSECFGTRPTSAHDYSVAQGAGIAFADVASLFCIENFCPLVIGDSPIVANVHLTDAAGTQIAPYLLDFLKDSRIPKT
jgi:peptidoglycan/LPS O-acetylase OafA/YrhL